MKTVQVKVSYGRKKDSYGSVSEFFNEGAYKNAKELMQAAIAFTNEL